jgi:DNA-binding transcriptional regulator YhcF (GntR family)
MKTTEEKRTAISEESKKYRQALSDAVNKLRSEDLTDSGIMEIVKHTDEATKLFRAEMQKHK